MADSAILEKINRLISPMLEDMGLELADLEYKRESRGWTLRIFIDKEGGVTLDDCADASREISALLDVEDVIETAYNLEVSSPGLDRPLKTLRDFERFQGRLAKVKTRDKLDPDGRGHERKIFVGELMGLADDRVRILQTDKKGGIVEIPWEEIEKANLEFDG
jgi:ribosome maturation factor RimP